MKLKTIFGLHVRNQRKARGLTQEVLAEKVDVSLETIGNIERGVSAPSFDTAERIAAALNVQPVALFGAASAPPGKRGRLLTAIGKTLASMNDEQLERVAKMLSAFTGK